MHRPIEQANAIFRHKAFKPTEIRATSRFSATEVAAICSPHADRKLDTLQDLRQIGCPDEIFERIVEERAATLGFTPQVDNDLAQRLSAASIF